MPNISASLEKIFQEQIASYQEIAVCLKDERASLIKINTDNLWKISEKKQEVILRIEALQWDIFSICKPYLKIKKINDLRFEQILSLVGQKDMLRFKKIKTKLNSLKEEIRLRAEENKRIVEDCLNFINDVASVFASASRSKKTYDRGMRIKEFNNSMLINSEV